MIPACTDPQNQQGSWIKSFRLNHCPHWKNLGISGTILFYLTKRLGEPGCQHAGKCLSKLIMKINHQFYLPIKPNEWMSLVWFLQRSNQPLSFAISCFSKVLFIFICNYLLLWKQELFCQCQVVRRRFYFQH